MAWVWRLLLPATVSFIALSPAAHAKNPPLTNACQLATTAEVRAVMHARVHPPTSTDPNLCAWSQGQVAGAGIEVYGYKTVRAAKEHLDADVRGFDLCGDDSPSHFLPGSRLGDDAWLDGCDSNIAFRWGRFAGMVHTYSQSVDEASPADTRRTANLTRKVVAHLHN